MAKTRFDQRFFASTRGRDHLLPLPAVLDPEASVRFGPDGAQLVGVEDVADADGGACRGGDPGQAEQRGARVGVGLEVVHEYVVDPGRQTDLPFQGEADRAL